MNQLDADVVIVGARCAGAALACFLRLQGLTVLLLERSAQGTDQVLSTHTVHPAGMAILDELEIGEPLRAGSRAMRHLRMVKDDGVLDLSLSPAQAEYCPRRARLDGLLQRRAVELGAELRDRTQVLDVLRRGERVVGVRARDASGREYDLHAALVVGADGRSSTIAERVNAAEYLGYDAPRAMYWGYFPAPADYVPRMQIIYRQGHARVAFATDDHHVLVGTLPPVESARAFAQAPLRMLREDIVRDPELGPLVAAEPSEAIRGVVRSRYFLRQPVGPGWALIGDAGLHKEYLTGDGISEALVQAKRLSEAVVAASQPALEQFWRARDVEALPRFCFGKDHGQLGPRPAAEGRALRYVDGDEVLKQRLAATLEHKLSPYEVVPPRIAISWMLRALFSGRLRLVSELWAMGRRADEVAQLVRAAAAGKIARGAASAHASEANGSTLLQRGMS